MLVYHDLRVWRRLWYQGCTYRLAGLDWMDLISMLHLCMVLIFNYKYCLEQVHSTVSVSNSSEVGVHNPMTQSWWYKKPDLKERSGMNLNKIISSIYYQIRHFQLYFLGAMKTSDNSKILPIGSSNQWWHYSGHGGIYPPPQFPPPIKIKMCSN